MKTRRALRGFFGNRGSASRHRHAGPGRHHPVRQRLSGAARDRFDECHLRGAERCDAARLSGAADRQRSTPCGVDDPRILRSEPGHHQEGRSAGGPGLCRAGGRLLSWTDHCADPAGHFLDRDHTARSHRERPGRSVSLSVYCPRRGCAARRRGGLLFRRHAGDEAGHTQRRSGRRGHLLRQRADHRSGCARRDGAARAGAGHLRRTGPEHPAGRGARVRAGDAGARRPAPGHGLSGRGPCLRHLGIVGPAGRGPTGLGRDAGVPGAKLEGAGDGGICRRARGAGSRSDWRAPRQAQDGASRRCTGYTDFASGGFTWLATPSSTTSSH